MPDINGFHPFTGVIRMPGPDFWPGPYTQWQFPNYLGSNGLTVLVPRPDLWSKK